VRRMSDRPDLLVGFDSAWTANNSGAIVPLLRNSDGRFIEFGEPAIADFDSATRMLWDWQKNENPSSTLILIDQPVVVTNKTGQRPIERIVSSAVCKRRGGMQPANTSKSKMFGPGSPIHLFLERFDAIETYPVQIMMALGWVLEDERSCGRLPKYNLANRRKFRYDDWQFVCDRVIQEFERRNLRLLCSFLNELKSNPQPRKHHQDQLDACICLLVAIQISESHPCMVIGSAETGSIVSPYGYELYEELAGRCGKIGLEPREWIREFSLEQMNTEKAGR